MTIIGLKELKQNASDIAKRTEEGETFVVVKRSKPIFKLSPIEEKPSSTKELEKWTEEAINKYRPALKALNNK